MSPAALFVDPRGPYPGLVDHWFDEARDARTFALDRPAICHPPCRGWGRLRHLAKPLPGETALALWAVDVVRQVGGIVEHPEASRLWPLLGLRPGQRDAWGGLLVVVDQVDYGHPARKRSGIYQVGGRSLQPRLFGRPSTVVQRQGRRARMATPYELACELVSLFA